jgi:hypothetical protein
LLARLARRRVDDLQALAESDDGDLLIVGMEADGCDRAVTNRRLENLLALGNVL